MLTKYTLVSLFACLFILSSCGLNEKLATMSPDSRLKIIVNVDDSITYRVSYDGKEVITPSVIDLMIKDIPLGVDAKIKQVQKSYVDEEIEPLYGKFKKLSDNYNETRIDFEGNFSLLLRAYDEGVAYRFVTDIEGDIIVKNEKSAFNIVNNPRVIYPETSNYTSWELMYIDYANTSAIEDGKRAITPVVYSMPDGLKVVVGESDLRDYPGMYLTKKGDSFEADFAQYPDSTALGSWGFVSVVQRTRGYIAKTTGKREFPWRVIMIADDDKKLLTNELIYKLAKPQVIEKAEWIRPGKAAWEWWHDATLTDTDIPSGMANRSTALYKHYIDFAAENRLEYLMIDAGWSDIFDLSQINPKVDVKEIIEYGNSKNVGVFLWCTAMALTDRADEFLKMMHDWGVVGIKVDFFDRDDQLAMQWYEDVARKAADNKLMVNFHGCSKPTGMQRTYPNIVNFEAVRGAECTKWDLTANPQHHLFVPYTRMLAGTLDYTPGAMRNRSPQTFKPIDPGMPSGLGTRCHELAMFVVYDQYLAMLCDSPSEYRKYPDIMRFLSTVPVTFDKTIALDGKMGESVLIAKQRGHYWYVGGMTNWQARDMLIDFSFLPSNAVYIAEIYTDGKDANLYADQYNYEKYDINNQTKLPVSLAQGGGVVVKVYPK